MTIDYAASIKYGFGSAFEVLCGSATNDLITPDQQKALQAIDKKKKEEEVAAWNAANKRPGSPYLSMALAGAGGVKRFKRDRTNSPCHLCQ